jgi:hypothetical protein
MNAESVLCSHCVEKKRVDIEKAILGEDAQRRRKGLQIIVDNIHPYIPPDYDLIDAAEKAVGEPSLEALRQLVDLSFVIHAARDAQAFKAPVLVDDHQLEQLHWHDIDELQQLKLAGLELRELVSAGLGLKVPIDLTVDRYIGLIKEIRPELLRITSELVQSGHDPKQKDVSLRRVFNSVSQINREVERIEQSTRFLLIEAAVGAASSNRELLAGLLAASALGATAGLLACGAGVATGMTAQILRKRGVLKGSVAMKRLGAAIHKDLEPMLTRLVAAYVGANEVPIRVIAIRKKLATARDPTHVQGEQASRTVERARQRRPVRAK